jgi:hypothetical protein
LPVYICRSIIGGVKIEVQSKEDAMTSADTLYLKLADHFEIIAKELRSYATEVRDHPQPTPDASFPDHVVAVARRQHQSIGPRQLEVLRLVAEAWPEGVTTGHVSKKLHLDQTQVYLVLKSMVERNFKFVRKDASTDPHHYYLMERLASEAGADV